MEPSSKLPAVLRMSPSPNYKKRRNSILRRLRREGWDAILVTNELNVSYLTGFSGDSSYLWLSRHQQILVSDSRYATQIQAECADLETVIRDAKSTQIDSLKKICRSSKAKSVGFEANHATKSLYDALNSSLDCELIESLGWVEDHRAIKDRFEIDRIRKSIAINERAFEVIRAQMTEDQTEREIAHNLEHQIRSFGGTRCSFDPIVGVGPNSALPHAVPTESKIGDSPFVLIDWGAQVQGYASDLTRVLVTAKIPPKLRKIYDIVLKAQLAAIKKIRPGVSFKDVDAVARGLIADAGYEKRFGHGLGHGFGLQIHEQPFVSPLAKGSFAENMVVTVEPGIYLPGFGGVRIEDDVLVTADGCEVLSRLPKSIDACTIDLI